MPSVRVKATKPRQGRYRTFSAATIGFFAAFLIIGLSVFRDYGISWDEFPTRQFGVMYVQNTVPDLSTLDSVRAVTGPAYERFGPLVEIVLVHMEKLMGPTDIRTVFYMRHLVTFLTFFLGVVCFHRLCRRRFSSGLALLACVCLVVSPQLFSHAFYNVKDISFLTLFVASILALDTALTHQTWRTMLVHAVMTVVLLGVRVLGVFAMMLTGTAAIARRPTRRTLLLLAGYGVVVVVLLPFVWPVLQIDFVHIVTSAVLGTTSNPYLRSDLFRGQAISASALPWDYVPTWILITTPMIVSALFVVGAARLVGELARRPKVFLCQERQLDVIVLCWFFMPVVGAAVLRPIMYDGWRHLFFVYPALVYVATAGMETVAILVTARVSEPRMQTAVGVLAAGLLLSLAPIVTFMVQNHPFEHIYFNRFAGRDMKEVKQRFELDYWGLSYRKSLEYIVRTDTASTIRLYVTNYPGRVNVAMLDPRDRARIAPVARPEDADYFVTNYRWHPEDYPFTPEVFSVRVGNASINSVFASNRRREQQPGLVPPPAGVRPR